MTQSITFVGPGPNVVTGTYTGTYTVNRNGTGTIALAPVEGQGPQTFVFVMTDDGSSGLLLLQTDRLGNGVSLGTAHLQVDAAGSKPLSSCN